MLVLIVGYLWWFKFGYKLDWLRLDVVFAFVLILLFWVGLLIIVLVCVFVYCWFL